MRYLLLLVLALYYHTVQAQNDKGKISGKIIDSVANTPVYYATVAVFPGGSKTPVNGATADEKGNFAVNGLSYGSYRVEIAFLGYRTFVANNVQVNAQTPAVKIGVVRLAGNVNKLKDVTITAERATVEYKNDKIVYVVGNDITSQGGVATDVLQKVPQVSVDVDGNVELQGNSNVRFLINGKPSSIFGNNLADALKSIPASQIKSIEVISNPGAKYDAEGTGGIINIILKDNKLQGVNGSVNLSAGTRLQNGAINLNIRNGNFGVNAFMSGNGQLTSTTLNTSDRSSYDASTATTTRFLQDGSSRFNRGGYLGGLNLNWDLSKKDNLIASMEGDFGENANKGPMNQQLTTTDNTGAVTNQYSVRNAETRINFHSADWSLNYRRTFDKEENQELNILYSSSYGNNYAYSSQAQASLAGVPFSGSTNTNPGTDNLVNVQADYTHPFGKEVLIETGAKTEIENISSTANLQALNTATNNYETDATQSYSLKFKRNVYAYYLSGTFPLFHYLNVKLGTRYEITQNKGDFSNVSNVSIPPYNTLVPALSMSHEFKNNQTVKFSYSHRIERPEYRELNPFVNASDPHNIITGNPSLQPEIADKFELGYRKTLEKGASFYVAAIYQKNTHDIKQVVSYYPSYVIGDSTYSNVSVTTYANVTSEERTGILAYASLPVTSKLSLRFNFLGGQRSVMNNGVSNKGLESRTNLNATYRLTKGITLEGFVNYNSPRIGLQGKYPSFLSYNFAFRKQLFHEKGSIAFTCTNPFNEYVTQRTELTDPKFTLVTTRQIPYRSFGVNLVYKFGKLSAKKKKEEDTNNQGNPFE